MTEHPDLTAGLPTPAQPRDLAADVRALRKRAVALGAAFTASADEGIRRIGYLIDDDGDGLLEGYLGDLDRAIEPLVRHRTATGPGLCGVPWGVCPEHGNTLRSSAGRTWCTATGCDRGWNYDRLGAPCGEPVAATSPTPAGRPGGGASATAATPNTRCAV
ncbi:hypothetical protein QRX50_36135 [Amycolatopsis carbonis]|uniref:Uncharacterized protein n=1 Tax=Amycolatopsis carbonis TaxID=715471 RepID=A0A9Y2IB39_9PSEU|nr:hypothetical protein [Amycolatopsis sp. 2-15]WIX76822.1 hypothetical protein QRX50_36135 [Amycolatopsis sp. 2-15]